MTKLIKPDQFLAHYIYEKQTNPDARIVMRSYQKRVVSTIDHIVELSHGDRDVVSTENDWGIVEELLKFFANQWPHEFNEFKASIPDIRSTRNDGGYSKSKEIKYVMAVPPRLERMIRVIFPMQQWDKKFVNKFVKRLPMFKVG